MLQGSLYKPKCYAELKPKVGMIFDDIGSVMEFYKTYAHNVGFGVRLGQQKSWIMYFSGSASCVQKRAFGPRKV